MSSPPPSGDLNHRPVFRDPGIASALSNGAARSDRLPRLQRLAELLDDRFRVPVLGWRLGLDSIMGLIPGLGDAAGALISAYIIVEARRLGVPKRVLLQMITNLGVDVLLGSVPLVGDVFDVMWKANRRNVDLLLRHMRERP